MPLQIDRLIASTVEVSQEITINGQSVGSGSSQNYKVYTALLTQSGTSAPVATVLENTIGDIVWSYGGKTGAYLASIEGGFDNSSTFILFGTINYPINTFISSVNDSNQIVIQTFNGVDASNDLLVFTPFEIRVYNQ